MPRQLKMKYRAPLPHTLPALPEGYTLCTLETDEDVQGWLDACAEGLGTGEWTPEDFKNRMLGQEGIEKEQIYLVKNPEGRVMATATAWQLSPVEGNLHMVSALPEARGLGLGYLVTQKVLDFFLAQGITDIDLSTDDFRLGAIKIYMKLGFVPLLWTYGMEERWNAIFEKIQLRTPCYKVTYQETEI